MFTIHASAVVRSVGTAGRRANVSGANHIVVTRTVHRRIQALAIHAGVGRASDVVVAVTRRIALRRYHRPACLQHRVADVAVRATVFELAEMSHACVAGAVHAVRTIAGRLALHPVLPDTTEIRIALFVRVTSIVLRTEDACAGAAVVFGAGYVVLAVVVYVALTIQNAIAARVADVPAGAKLIAGLTLAVSIHARIGVAVGAFLVAVIVVKALGLADATA
jgi:hypothetical protein